MTFTIQNVKTLVINQFNVPKGIFSLSLVKKRGVNGVFRRLQCKKNNLENPKNLEKILLQTKGIKSVFIC